MLLAVPGLFVLNVLVPGVFLDGDAVGVLIRRGEGDTGDSGRLNGEFRFGEEPYRCGGL